MLIKLIFRQDNLSGEHSVHPQVSASLSQNISPIFSSVADFLNCTCEFGLSVGFPFNLAHEETQCVSVVSVCTVFLCRINGSECNCMILTKNVFSI